MTLENSKKCGGACCRRFTLPYPPEQLKEKYLAWYRRDYERETIPQDIHLIYPMVTYLGFMRSEPYQQNELHWYTCKHLDEETSLCKIYEIRPKMCREFPYESKCPYSGCKDESI